MEDITTLEQTILAEIGTASDEATLEAIRVSSLGKKGSVSQMMKTLGSMSPEERQEAGPAFNGLKATVAEAITLRRSALEGELLVARLVSEKTDVTLPVRQSPSEAGRIHPISQVMDEITAIFADMGFSIAEGPDIETGLL